MHHATGLPYSRGSLIVRSLTSDDFRSISDLSDVETSDHYCDSFQVANRPGSHLKSDF